MFRRLSFLVFIFTSVLSFEVWFSENERIVSPSSIFELGLFKDRTGWYLGIWFRQFPGRVVWTGNRGSPLYSSEGKLQISSSAGIQLFDESGYMTWHRDLTSPAAEDDAPLSAYLSDTGNFIVSNYSGGILWGSFDYPSNVLIPGMVLGYYPGLDYIRTITYDDIFHEGGTETGYEHYIWGSSGTKICRIDPIYTTKAMIQTRTTNSYTYSLRRNTTTSYYASLKMSDTGFLIWSEWTRRDRKWKDLVIAPSDICDKYTTCGSGTNTYCSMNPLKSCECFPGFRPQTDSERNQDSYALHGHCVRKSPLACSDDDGFQLLKNMKLPETDNWTISYEGVGLEECKERCLTTCNCTAFANTDMPTGVRSCVMWTVSLEDTRRYSTNRGQNLYVKLAALDMERKRSNQNKKKRIIGFTVGAIVLLLLIVVVTFCCCWKRNNNAVLLAPAEVTNQNLPVEEEEEEEEDEDEEEEEEDEDEEDEDEEEEEEDDEEEEEEWRTEVDGCLQSNLIIVVFSTVTPTENVSRSAPEEETTGSLTSLFMEFDVIAQATNNFSDEIGSGGFAKVYKILQMWNLWLQGKVLDIVDPYFTSSSSSSYQPEEALRCIQIGLLCVQAHREDRPPMASIILMLGSQNELISLPKPPADLLLLQDPQGESFTASVATA
ncbi:unnamed protein product [Brassica napus]|uniref:(rape) hypothetical protein n=1 Tax=Brassica napus TaxID=3708 RepID=A0A817A8M5_BRANA|nr:unnamed protein product [Brassica napus]